MKPKPLRDFLTVKIKAKPKKDEEGNLLPEDQWNQLNNVGKITAKGSHVVGFEVGDEVIFNVYAILEIFIDSDKKPVYFIKQDDIIGKL